MKSTEFWELLPDAKVLHKRYGVCTVKEIIPDFGVVVMPDTERGKFFLVVESGSNGDTPLLEDKCKNLSHYQKYELGQNVIFTPKGRNALPQRGKITICNENDYGEQELFVDFGNGNPQKCSQNQLTPKL